MMRRLRLSVPVSFVVAGLLTLAVAQDPPRAHATTGDNLGIPKPKVLVPGRDVEPIVGRFLLAAVSRGARLSSAQLDVGPENLGTWFYGELELHVYSARGMRTTVNIAVYEFTYSNGTLSAALIPFPSVTLQHPYGVSAGRISFNVPLKDTGLAENAVELKELTAEFTLNGRGPYNLRFKRLSADQPVPDPLPKAKQVG